MKKLKLFYLCLFMLVVISGSLFAQWNLQYTFTPAQSLQCVRFYDANTGYTTAPVYGGSMLEIHKTTNAGVNWVDQNAGFTGERFMGIWIVHPDTVYISGNTGHLLKTVNGGNNWNLLTTNTTEQLWGLQFTNSFTGYAAGSNGLVIKTTDAGATWFQQPTAIPNALSYIFFRNENTGYISGGSIIIKTTNAGSTWSGLSAAYISLENIRQIIFIDDNTGYAVSDADRIFKTTNAGSSWTITNSGAGQSLFGVYFTDANTGFACGFNGVIIRTSNAGANWTQQTSGVTDILTSIWFTSASTGYISTWYSKILKTTNGGLVFAEPISENVPVKYSLEQNYPNPFNPTTNIKFNIPPSKGERGMTSVTLKVFDILGNQIETLVDEQLKPGEYVTHWNAANYPSGVYLYKLNSGSFSETRRMILVK